MTTSAIACRTGAVLAAGSAALHGVALTGGHHVVVAVLTLAMAVGCLYCAAELWMRGTARAWVLVAVMNLAMIGVHLPMAAHQHGAAVLGTATPASAAMTAATLLAVIEVLLATVVLGVRSRRYAPRVPDIT
jgi:hypothetical protein